MKSEPDRLDLLIVVLPIILLVIMGVQIYRFVQMSGQRAPGAALAEEVVAMTSASPEPAAGAPAPEGSPRAEPGVPVEEPPAEEGGAIPPGQDAVPSEDAAAPGSGESEGVTGAGAIDPPADRSPAAAGATTAPATAGSSTPANRVTSPPGSGSRAPADRTGPAPGLPERPAASRGTPSSSPSPIVGAVPVAAPPPDPAPGDAAEPPDDAAPPRDLGGGVGAPPDGPGDGDGSVPVDPSRPAAVTAVVSRSEYSVGEVVAVDVLIQNGNNVASVPFHLHYNPSVLQMHEPSGARGTFLEVPGISTQFLVAPGHRGNNAVVGLSLMGATTGVSGDGLLATLNFVAVNPGTSNLGFANATVRGPDAGQLPATFQSTTVTVIP